MRQQGLIITSWVSFWLILFGALSLPQSTQAGGPLIVTKRATPYAWDTSRPVPFNPDQGPLGRLSNEQAVALTGELFQVWQDVRTASIEFQRAASLPLDITGSNVMPFLNNAPPGVNPIIYDTDGSVIDALIGAGARLLAPGAATPLLGNPETGEILQSVAILNGLFIDGVNELLRNPEIPLSRYRTTFVHEFGHFIGLDHSALNTREALDNDTTNDTAVPTMFPQLVSDEQATLHLDDIVAVSELYPTPEYLWSKSTIRGRVLFPDGSGFQGANVVARNINDPLNTAVSCVSGFLHTGTKRGPDFGSDDPALRGYYELNGLPPGTYTIEISPINPQFRGGSSVGPLSPPAALPETQFYVAPAQPASANPSEGARLHVLPSSVTDGVDIAINARMLSLTRVQGRPGTIVEVPVLITDASEISWLAFNVTYDPQTLSVLDSGAVSRGPVVPNNFTVTALKLSSNQVTVSITPPLTNLRATLNSFSGVLVHIRFRILPQARPGTISLLEISDVVALKSNGDLMRLLPQAGAVAVIP